MRKLNRVRLAAAVLVTTALAVGCPPGNIWTITFGNTGNESAYGLVPATGGGWAMAGPATSAALGASGSDMCLVKVKPGGSIDWYNLFGGIGSQQARALVRTTDGGYLLAGYTFTTGATADVLLVKVNALGVESWQSSFGTTGDEEAYAVQQTSDGGYIVAGTTQALGGDNRDFYLVKTLANGTVDWDQVFGAALDDLAFAVRQTADGGYIVVGSTEVGSPSTTQIYVVKTNTAGVAQWAYTYGGAGHDEAHDVVQTGDGGYLLVGATTPAASSISDAYIIKLYPNGVVQWTKTIGGTGSEVAHAITPVTGGYIIAGKVAPAGIGQWDAYLLKVDAAGNKRWSKRFGASSDDTAQAVQQTPAGGYVLAGTTASYGVGGTDMYLIKTDEFGRGSSSP